MVATAAGFPQVPGPVVAGPGAHRPNTGRGGVTYDRVVCRLTSVACDPADRRPDDGNRVSRRGATAVLDVLDRWSPSPPPGIGALEAVLSGRGAY